jgi:hypothetical protein
MTSGVERVFVSELGEAGVAVDGQRDEDHAKCRRPCHKEQSRLPPGHAHLEGSIRRERAGRRAPGHTYRDHIARNGQTPIFEKLPIPIHAVYTTARTTIRTTMMHKAR